MSRFLLFGILLISTVSYGQNWQSIKSNQIHYFLSADQDYFLATRTDSSQFIAGDSVFYSFRTPRDGAGSCIIELTPSWIGEKVIIEGDGSNLFFNENLDTILLETQAALNDTFLVYNYPGGDYIKGWVSDVSEETHLGILDSVKTISLFSNSPDFDLLDAEIKIGKSLGFLKLFPMYSFPEIYVRIHNSGVLLDSMPYTLAGSENLSTGFIKPTTAEYFDYEIGDKIFYGKSAFHWSSYTGESWMYEINILDKTLWGADSVEYEREVKWKHQAELWEAGPIETTFGESTSLIKYYDLDQKYDPFLPEEWMWDGSSSWPWTWPLASWNTMTFDMCNKLTERKYFVGGLDFNSADSNCLEQGTLGWDDYYIPWVIGLGGYFQNGTTYDGWGHNVNGAFIFYSDPDGDCGTEAWIELEENIGPSQMKVYPNPATDILEVVLFSSSVKEIKLFDFSGKLVGHETMQSAISVSDLPAGIYVIVVSDGENSYQQKVAKI